MLLTGEKTLIANGMVNIADIPGLITIKVPPLRIRREDLGEIFQYNLKLICRQRQVPVPILIPEAKRRIERSVYRVSSLQNPTDRECEPFVQVVACHPPRECYVLKNIIRIDFGPVCVRIRSQLFLSSKREGALFYHRACSGLEHQIKQWQHHHRGDAVVL